MSEYKIFVILSFIFLILTALLIGFFAISSLTMKDGDGANIGGGLALLSAIPTMLVTMAFAITALIFKKKQSKLTPK